ncbi:hypothetical protein CFC21_100352 [Triticum aestivum]|uniref:Uncharacterized protein n=2 Tax=Triticum aestivum TaxID=4565 RepID=A0A3B6RS47_WHEAT|nr:hypothetical protein CFC21_100352 [Triticum aestivum]
MATTEKREMVFFNVEAAQSPSLPDECSLLELAAILVCPRRLVEVSSYSTLNRPDDTGADGGVLSASSGAPSFKDVFLDIFEMLDGRVHGPMTWHVLIGAPGSSLSLPYLLKCTAAASTSRLISSLPRRSRRSSPETPLLAPPQVSSSRLHSLLLAGQQRRSRKHRPKHQAAASTRKQQQPRPPLLLLFLGHDSNRWSSTCASSISPVALTQGVGRRLLRATLHLAVLLSICAFPERRRPVRSSPTRPVRHYGDHHGCMGGAHAMGAAPATGFGHD